ncbi:Bicoid-interacting protein 3-domain-containing protein [Sporodiniella umbellata]|nr:Bicoid-interacting protein 3-domain-containing protein [Sporodiniella umbellata]
MKRTYTTPIDSQPAKLARMTKNKGEEKMFGNYSAYYTSRRVPKGEHAIDPRIDLLSDQLFHGKTVLDIGCNSGNLTIGIAKQKQPTSILGVDIDAGLIANAKKNIQVVYSLSSPTGNDRFDLSLKRHYFPLSMSHCHGFIPMNLPQGTPRQGFPYNVQFEASDWTQSESKETFDTILALSVTKWIQLHGGDQGLQAFFQKIFRSLKVGGTLVLEAQEFSSFQKRAKVNVEDRFFFRPEHYTDYLIQTVGFKSYQDLGVPQDESKGFSRPVILYRK